MTAAVEAFANPHLPFSVAFSLWDSRPPTSSGCSWDSAAQPHSSPCSTTTTSSTASLDSLALQLLEQVEPSQQLEQKEPQQQARAVLARRPRLREQAEKNVDVLGFSELHILACCVPPQVAKALQEQRLNELQGSEPYIIVPKLDDWCWEQLADLPDRLGRAVVYQLLGTVDAMGSGAADVNVPELFRDILRQLKEPGQLGTRSSGGVAGSPAAPSSPAAATASPAAGGTYACAATHAGSPRPVAASSRALGQQQQSALYRPPGRRSCSGAGAAGGRRPREEWWPEVRAAIQALVAASNGMYQLADFDDALMSHLREMGEEAAWKKLERIHGKLYGLRRETIRNMSAFLMSA